MKHITKIIVPCANENGDNKNIEVFVEFKASENMFRGRADSTTLNDWLQQLFEELDFEDLSELIQKTISNKHGNEWKINDRMYYTDQSPNFVADFVVDKKPLFYRK